MDIKLFTLSLPNGDEAPQVFVRITRHTGSPKFGGSGICEYVWRLSMESGQDEDSGNVEAPTGWFARFGKRILHTNDQGRVWLETCSPDTAGDQIRSAVDVAKAVFAELDTEFSDWLNDAACVECGTEFDSENDSACPECGSKNWADRSR